MFHFDKSRLSVKLTTAVTAVLAASAIFIETPANAALPAARHTTFRPTLNAVTTPVIYVADQANKLVWVFNAPVAPPPASPSGATAPINAKPVRAIPTGTLPTGLTVDSSGDLYVANFLDNDVQEYAPGSSTPFRTYSVGLSHPIDIKVSLSGVLYVSNLSGGTSPNTGDIVVYPPNSTTPSMTWQSPVAGVGFEGLALQSPDYAGPNNTGGDVYVAYGGLTSGATSGIFWCPIGSATCFDTGISTSGLNASLAFQYNTFPLTLLVPDERNSVVDVYHLRHGRTPAAALPVAGAAGLAFDPSFTHLFVASNPGTTTASLNEYNYPSGTLCTTFTLGAAAASPVLLGVAVYPSATY